MNFVSKYRKLADLTFTRPNTWIFADIKYRSAHLLPEFPNKVSFLSQNDKLKYLVMR